MATAVTLSNGMKMPLVGLGTWLALNEQEIETAVDEALAAGYRHFDTAYMYTNEKVIGKVLKKWIDSGKVKREELFIVTKLPMIGMSATKVSHFVKLQLEALQLSYIDLYLIHGPVGLKYVNDTEMVPKHPDGKVVLDLTTDLEAIWKAMEKEVDAGRLKSLGVSNFSVSQVERIVKIARIPLVNNQIECHVYLQQKELRATCAKHNIVVCAYAPIGSPGRKALYESRGITFDVESPLEEPVVKELAQKYNKSTAQVLLRFLTQQGIVVIPKSTNPARLKQNFQILDFQLTPTEMETLERLDRGKEGRTFDFKSFPGCEVHPELPY